MEIGSEETINYNTKPTLIKAIIKKDRYLGEVTLAKKITALPFHPPPHIPLFLSYQWCADIVLAKIIL